MLIAESYTILLCLEKNNVCILFSDSIALCMLLAEGIPDPVHL